MDIQFTDKTPLDRYHLLVQSVIPRPIAWILTAEEDGHLNLAPYSFFAPVCSAPPTLVVSMGQKSAGVEKDSFRNLKRSGWCVVNIADATQVDAVNISSSTLAAGISETSSFDIQVEPQEAWPLPRVAAAPVAFLCRYQQQVDLGSGPQHVVFLEIERMFIDEGVVSQDGERLVLNSELINPLARLGGAEYSELGDRIVRGRPE
ncbi:flavin reductase family protein [Thalassolituus sp.]|uniref:flavin reductase family protein n=1 Tax=Thalassolituus sp. TaxID=2030822 RepID=UPI0035113CC1